MGTELCGPIALAGDELVVYFEWFTNLGVGGGWGSGRGSLGRFGWKWLI
jgi:hypothetical protein